MGKLATNGHLTIATVRAGGYINHIQRWSIDYPWLSNISIAYSWDIISSSVGIWPTPALRRAEACSIRLRRRPSLGRPIAAAARGSLGSLGGGWLPSGKRLHNYGKAPFFIGNFSTHGHMAIFNDYISYVINCHRVVGVILLNSHCGWSYSNSWKSYMIIKGSFTSSQNKDHCVQLACVVLCSAVQCSAV